MAVHPRTHAILRPEGPALGYHEGQVLAASAGQLADAGLASLSIDLGRVRWMNGPGLRALLSIQHDWQDAGRALRLLNLPEILSPKPDSRKTASPVHQ